MLPTLAPVVATRLTFGFEADTSSPGGAHVSEQLQSGLSRAGFRFAAEPTTEADARFVARVTADDASGRPKLSLVLVRGEATVEWATAVVGADADEAARIDELVARMCSSNSVETFAAARVEDREREAARTRGLPKFAPEKTIVAAPATDPGLGAVALRRCRNARDESACEPVRAYLRDHPNGASAAQAEAAWKVASARFARREPEPGE